MLCLWHEDFSAPQVVSIGTYALCTLTFANASERQLYHINSQHSKTPFFRHFQPTYDLPQFIERLVYKALKL